MYTDEGSGYERYARFSNFACAGTLTAPYPATTDATGFTVTEVGYGLAYLESTDAAGLLAGEILALVGSEILSVREITPAGAGTYAVTGVMRGQMDTVPADHAAGATVFLFRNPESLAYTFGPGYGSDLTVSAKLATVTASAVLPLADAAALTLTTSSRIQKPYPPANVRVNGLGCDAWPATTVGDVTLTWSHRNRVAQTALVAQDTAGAYAIEGTLTIEVLIGGVVEAVRTVVGETGTSLAYTWAQRQADDADLTKPVQFRITPINGSYTGTVRTTPPFVMW